MTNRENKKLDNVVIDTKEVVDQKNDELTERINRLYGVPVQKEIKKEYDPKELEEVRKKLILLLLAVIVGGIIILILIFNPFKNKEKSQTVPSEQEKKEQEEKLPLGEISLSNPIVEKLNNRFSFTVNDYMNINLFPLYSNNKITSNEIPNDIKLYLLKGTEEFRKLLIEEKVEDYIATCNASGIVISKDKIDTIAKGLFGDNVKLEYQPINYEYYSEILSKKKLTLNYVNNQYIVTCNDYPTNIQFDKLTQHQLIRAEKIEGAIEIYQRVVFINPNGVFVDPSFSSLITADKTSSFENYIGKGSIYKYTFQEKDKDFYLSAIERVQEIGPS